MKRENVMKLSKRALFCCLAAAFLSFSGCSFLSELYNPLLGSWTSTQVSGTATTTMTMTFISNRTWIAAGSMTDTSMPGLEISLAGTGTFVQDLSAKTLDMTGTITMTVSGMSIDNPVDSTNTYAIDGTTLVITDTASSTSSTFTRNQ